MSLFVLDTDISSLFRNGHPIVTQRVLSHPIEELSVTVITVEEMLQGWQQRLRRTKSPEALEAIYQEMARTVMFLGRLTVLNYTVPAQVRFSTLIAMKLNVGSFDLRIAAITLERGAILVTRNARDFARVPGLTIENWSMEIP